MCEIKIKNISNSLEKAPQLGGLIEGGAYSRWYSELSIKVTISYIILGYLTEVNFINLCILINYLTEQKI